MEATNKQLKYQIELTGSFAKKGFGFSCMQKALEMGITGKLEYINEGLIRILVQGSEKDISEINTWFVKIPDIKDIKYHKVHASNTHFNDFIIVNSI